MNTICKYIALAAWLLLLNSGPSVASGSIDPFVGSYVGSVDVDTEDGSEHRDMSVEIQSTRKGFSVSWSSIIQKADGRTKDRTYKIDFVESDRDNVFTSAMKTNVFGHAVPLDPMKGDPYVWGRIAGDTLTVFSLYVDSDGGYEMQEYNRTLTDGGLQLDYQRIRNGEPLKSINTFLRRE